MKKVAVSLLLGGGLTLAVLAPHAFGQQAPPPPPPPPSYIPPTVGPPPPIFSPTATPAPTLAPTTVLPTVGPTTPAPLTAAISLSSSSVKPKKKETVTVKTEPGANVTIKVRFPNGDTKGTNGTAGSAGTVTFSYVQPGSRITKSSRKATVTAVAATGSSSAQATATYTIGYAALDVSAQPRTRKPGKQEAIYVHTAKGTAVTVHLAGSGATLKTVIVKTASSGWAYVAYNIPSRAKAGKVDVKATATVKRKKVSGETSFTIK